MEKTTATWVFSAQQKKVLIPAMYLDKYSKSKNMSVYICIRYNLCFNADINADIKVSLMPPPDETRRGVEIVVQDFLKSYDNSSYIIPRSKMYFNLRLY